MGPVAYFKWDSALEQGNVGVAASVASNKFFLFYLLEQLDLENDQHQPALQTCVERLDTFPLNIWEKLELALYRPSVATRNVLIEEAFSHLLKGTRIQADEGTLVHVHVPKAAGTSLNVALKNHFYNEDVTLPANNTPNAMRIAFQQFMGKIPYIPTGHVPLDWLVGKNELSTRLFRPFMVLRDHRSRLNSMRNQLALTLLTGRFFNRPYAYRQRIGLRNFCNRYFFPVHQERLTNTNSASLAQDLGNAKSVLSSFAVEVIKLSDLSQHFVDRIGVAVKRERKNRTYNVSALLPEIPKSYSQYDTSLFS